MLIYWNRVNLVEAIRITRELAIYFHDYPNIILVGVLVRATLILRFRVTSPYMNKYFLDSHTLEFIWTVIPMLILICIAAPSLSLPYTMEDGRDAQVSIKIIAHQWY